MTKSKMVKRRPTRKVGGFVAAKDVAEHLKTLANSASFYANEEDCEHILTRALSGLGMYPDSCKTVPKITLIKMAKEIAKYRNNFNLVDAIKSNDLELFKFAIKYGGVVLIKSRGILSQFNIVKELYYRCKDSSAEQKQKIFEFLIIEALRISNSRKESRASFVKYLTENLK